MPFPLGRWLVGPCKNCYKARVLIPPKTYIFGLFAVLILACQSASTQPSGETTPVERVTDEKPVKLEPQASKQISKDILTAALKKYASSKSVKIDLVKTTKLKLLNRTEESTGVAYLQGKSKLRLEFSEPTKSVAVMNGKKAWIIEYPPQDSEEKVRVSKFSVANQAGKGQVLITSILSGGLKSTFKVGKRQVESDRVGFELVPKKPIEEIKTLKVFVSKAQEISEIRYADPLDNETAFKFLKTDFKAQAPAALFNYDAPKGAEINEF